MEPYRSRTCRTTVVDQLTAESGGCVVGLGHSRHLLVERLAFEIFYSVTRIPFDSECEVAGKLERTEWGENGQKSAWSAKIMSGKTVGKPQGR